MFFLVFTCIVSGLPMMYPISKLFRLKDITLLDLLALFTGMFFCIIPITSSDYVELIPENLNIFIFYSFFSYSLLIVSLYLDRCKSVSYYIRFLRFDIFDVNYLYIGKFGIAFIIVLFIVILLEYIPNASLTTRDLDSISKYSYAQKSYQQILTIVHLLLGFLLSFIVNVKLKNRSNNILYIGLLIFFIVMSAFLRRRVLLFQILIFTIIFYKLNRNLINIRIVFTVSCLLGFIAYIWFPFFNVIRNNDIVYDSNRPINSLINVITYGIDNWDAKKEHAEEVTEGRSINVYDAVLNLAKYQSIPMLGEIIMLEIDVAIPQLLNPNKGVGSQGLIEKLTKKNKDIADSFFLEEYADFMILGGFSTIVLYLLVFLLYALFSYIATKMFHSLLLPMFLLVKCIDICWNVEITLGSVISFFFIGSIVFFIVFIIEKFKLIIVIK